MSLIEFAQWLILVIQVSSLIYCICKSANPLETHFGISVFAVIPVIALGFLK